MNKLSVVLSASLIAFSSAAVLKKMNDREQSAVAYSKQGNDYKAIGDLDNALEMYNKSLKIYRAQGSKVGLADTYGNLGTVYLRLGDLDKAGAMQYKSLEINQALGRKTGLAAAYVNLGAVYGMCGDRDRAEKMFNKSLILYQKIGSKLMVEKVQGILNSLAAKEEVAM